MIQGEITIEFIKKHGRAISNVLVAALVLCAIYAKMQEDGADSLFRQEDLGLLAGAILAFIVLRLWTKRHEQRK